MKQYLDLVKKILIQGEDRGDRTGIGTRALFGEKMIFDNVHSHFPAVTCKHLAFKPMAAELYCFLQSYEFKAQFNAAGCKIWDGNIDAWNAQGWAGRIYGVQWRKWQSKYSVDSVDQIAELIKTANARPTDRRLVVTAWNPGELTQMCLPPCHMFFQVYCREPGILDLQVYLRSLDMMLGAPFDIASYALLMHILGRDLDRIPGTLTLVSGDTHIYKNHISAAIEVINRRPLDLPHLVLSPECRGVDSFLPEHATLNGYISHPAVNFPLNV